MESKAPVNIPAATFALRSVSPSGAQGRLQNVRLAFVNIKEPRVDKANPLKASYSVTALIPKADFQSVFGQVMDAVKQHMPLSKKIVERDERITAYNEAKATGEKRALFKLGDNITDKGKKPYDGFAGHYAIQIKTTLYRKDVNEEFAMRVPLTLMDKRGLTIPQVLADRDLYSGCFAHVALTVATYDFQGSKGVTCYLNGLMKVADAERLGASNPFADVEPVADDIPSGMMSDDDVPF